MIHFLRNVFNPNLEIEKIEAFLQDPDDDPALVYDVPRKGDFNESNLKDESLETIGDDDGNNKMKRKIIIFTYKKLQEFPKKYDTIYHLMTILNRLVK